MSDFSLRFLTQKNLLHRTLFLRIVLNLSTTARLAIIVAEKKGKILYTNRGEKKTFVCTIDKGLCLIVFVLCSFCVHAHTHIPMRSRLSSVKRGKRCFCVFLCYQQKHGFSNFNPSQRFRYLTTQVASDFLRPVPEFISSTNKRFIVFGAYRIDCDSQVQFTNKNKREFLSLISHSSKSILIRRANFWCSIRDKRFLMQFSMMKFQLWKVIKNLKKKPWNSSKE